MKEKIAEETLRKMKQSIEKLKNRDGEIHKVTNNIVKE